MNLPKDTTDFVAMRCHAQDLAAAANVAYWMAGRDENSAVYHAKQADDAFHKLAAIMGYTVTRDDPVAMRPVVLEDFEEEWVEL